MPRRSIRVTLLNNTSHKLTLVGNSLCSGIWTSDQWKPPAEIQPKTQEGWQSESGGDIPIIGDIGKGTEGWVQYMIENTDVEFPSGTLCRPELVYIHWNNPFVWVGENPLSAATVPIEIRVSTSPIVPPCDEEKGSGSTFSVLQGGTSSDQHCRHELFVAGMAGQGISNITWWDAIVNWPAILGLLVLGPDFNLQFTLGLRQVGSVDQTLHSLYDGRKGLRAVAHEAGKSSLRQLFRM